MSAPRHLAAWIFVVGCAPKPTSPMLASCPADTTLEAPGICVEKLPVARGSYRECAAASPACAPPRFRDYVAWGADHAADAMLGVPEASQRAYCAWVGRQWHDGSAAGFHCSTTPGAHGRTRPLCHPGETRDLPVQRNDPTMKWPGDGVFMAALMDDAGDVACARLIVERGAKGELTLVWPKPLERFPFELRSGVLRFRDPNGFEDWALGNNEGGASVFVGGSPWTDGLYTCENKSPPLRPMVRPLTSKKPALVRDDRVMFLREPGGRCVRAGLEAGRGRSGALRVEASAGDRFFLVSEYPDQGRVFVSPVDVAAQKSGLLPTGLQSLKIEAGGYRLGDATLSIDEAACLKEPPAKPRPDAFPFTMRRIDEAFVNWVRTHHEAFVVSLDGSACERVELESPEGFPLVGTWKLPGATYHAVLDAEGVWLTTGACVEHRELRGAAYDGFLLGESALFESRQACELQRKSTRPFVPHCVASTLPADSLTAAGDFEGFDASFECAPATLTFRPSFELVTAGPSKQGQLVRRKHVTSFYEWPAHHVFADGKWITAERSAKGPLILHWPGGDEILHPTLAACRKATGP